MAVTYYLQSTKSAWQIRDAEKIADYRLLEYASNRVNLHPEDYQVIEKVDFKGHVRILDFYRGRSASGVYVVVDGHPFGKSFIANMSSANLVKLLKNEIVTKGEATGMFTLAKQGANYFVQYIGGIQE